MADTNADFGFDDPPLEFLGFEMEPFDEDTESLPQTKKMVIMPWEDETNLFKNEEFFTPDDVFKEVCFSPTTSTSMESSFQTSFDSGEGEVEIFPITAETIKDLFKTHNMQEQDDETKPVAASSIARDAVSVIKKRHGIDTISETVNDNETGFEVFSLPVEDKSKQNGEEADKAMSSSLPTQNQHKESDFPASKATNEPTKKSNSSGRAKVPSAVMKYMSKGEAKGSTKLYSNLKKPELPTLSASRSVSNIYKSSIVSDAKKVVKNRNSKASKSGVDDTDKGKDSASIASAASSTKLDNAKMKSKKLDKIRRHKDHLKSSIIGEAKTIVKSRGSTKPSTEEVAETKDVDKKESSMKATIDRVNRERKMMKVKALARSRKYFNDKNMKQSESTAPSEEPTASITHESSTCVNNDQLTLQTRQEDHIAGSINCNSFAMESPTESHDTEIFEGCIDDKDDLVVQTGEPVPRQSLLLSALSQRKSKHSTKRPSVPEHISVPTRTELTSDIKCKPGHVEIVALSNRYIGRRPLGMEKTRIGEDIAWPQAPNQSLLQMAQSQRKNKAFEMNGGGIPRPNIGPKIDCQHDGVEIVAASSSEITGSPSGEERIRTREEIVDSHRRSLLIQRAQELINEKDTRKASISLI